MTQIEHFVPVSEDEGGINDYSNCFYACVYCNQKRHAVPVDSAAGAVLLNPCRDVWQEHFTVDGDAIVPREGDVDAAYTHSAYNFNDPRKVKMRQIRRETISECLDLIERGRPVLTRLLERAREEQRPELVDEAKLVQDALRRAWRDVEAFMAVPEDAPGACGCSLGDRCSLPRVLDEQTVDVEATSG